MRKEMFAMNKAIVIIAVIGAALAATATAVIRHKRRAYMVL